MQEDPLKTHLESIDDPNVAPNANPQPYPSSNPAQPPLPKPGASSKIVVACIVGAVMMVIIIITVLLLAPTPENKEDTTGNPTQESSGEQVKPEENEEQADPEEDESTDEDSVVSRNLDRQQVLSGLITSVNDYQTNNSGKTPFEEEYVVNSFFIQRYYDTDVVWNADAPVGQEVTACGEDFVDPDGTCYQMVHSGMATGSGVITKTDFDYTFYVYTKAKCGEEEGTYVQGPGKRQVAIFLTVENGITLCEDNS